MSQISVFLCKSIWRGRLQKWDQKKEIWQEKWSKYNCCLCVLWPLLPFEWVGRGNMGDSPSDLHLFTFQYLFPIFFYICGFYLSLIVEYPFHHFSLCFTCPLKCKAMHILALCCKKTFMLKLSKDEFLMALYGAEVLKVWTSDEFWPSLFIGAIYTQWLWWK